MSCIIIYVFIFKDALNGLYYECEYEPNKTKELFKDTFLCTVCFVSHTFIKYLQVITLSVTFDISFF